MLHVILLLFLLCFSVKSSQSQEPCKLINIKSDLITKGIVNVIYLMNNSCDSCYYEAAYLPTLQSDMLSRGIMINPIIGINSAPEKVSTHAPGISIDSGKLWKILGEHNSHVFILDKCNRLAYEVISPWSLFKLPFVKAAILSTYHSEPCGICQPDLEEKEIVPTKTGLVEYPPMKRRTSLNSVLVSAEENIIPPMRIIYKQPHIHEGDPTVYNEIELLADDPAYHYHPEDENDIFFGLAMDDNVEKINEENNEGDDSVESSKDDHADDGMAEGNKDKMDKDKLWMHYFNILLWLPHV